MKLKEFHKKHRITPLPDGVTSGYTICSCGARWRTGYTDQGLIWTPENDLCETHDSDETSIEDDPDAGWGGARAGAGRKPLAGVEPTVEGTISLPVSLDAKAKRIGDGNRSAGIRKALESFTE